MKLVLNFIIAVTFMASTSFSQEIPFIGSWISAEKLGISDEFVELTFTRESFTDSAGMLVPYRVINHDANNYTIAWTQESAIGEVERKSSVEVLNPSKIIFSWSAGLGDPIVFIRKQ
jgi:hypothetical protein